MRISVLFLASAALLAGACNAEKSSAPTSNGPEVTAAPVPAPNNGDWSTIVTQTPEGGFLMGNPDAKVKLVEFGSMTCPHCAAFDEEGGKPLIENYVKKGLVSWEFRNYVRDPFDMTASLLARCAGEAGFFGLTRNLFADQKDWIGKAQQADQATLQGLQNQPPAKQFSAIADLAGLKQYVSMRGVPRAKAEQCLANQAEVDQLVQMTSDAVAVVLLPDSGSRVINGSLVEQVAGWDLLEPKIKEALGG
ncbi:MAG: DsbA family protein [Sphingomonas sp.]|nr:DsbA family protein [Sphingomonas sp.]